MTLTDEQLERYSRHILLKEIGGEGQQKLLKARVLVIGAGGLGTPTLLYLAAAGIGTIGIVDSDIVTLSNLQRQIAYSVEDVGKPKITCVQVRLSALNPDIKIVPYAQRLDNFNADQIINDFDIVVDGSDNFTTRFTVNDSCYRLKKTLVSGALQQFNGLLSTFKSFAKNDEGQFHPCYRCFMPATPPRDPVPNCNDEGILGAVAGVLGSLQAVEVIKDLTGAGEGLVGRLLVYEGLSGRFRISVLKRDTACPLCRAR